MKRRQILKMLAAAPAAGLWANSLASAAPSYDFPRVTFYGAARQVSGSCHLLETSSGLYLIDCGRFVGEAETNDRENRDLPFDPKEVKAVLLTHAHSDHHGRLPLLYRRGFRGKIYCTDATRDLTLLSFGGGPIREDDDDPLFDASDVQGMLEQIEAIPYNQKVGVDKLTVRYTDAGHILGSAMIEIWVDGRKILFGGDMGPDDAPILHAPAAHFSADALLVESTYGPSRRTRVDYREFGKRVATVLDRGGDVLIPTFAVHKSQILIYVLQTLVQEGIISRKAPIYCDSSTVHNANRIYDSYREYHNKQARKFADQHGSLFYMGKYREGRVEDFLRAHGGTPSIFVATSGMLAYAASPRHLQAMADSPKNAIFIPGYQAPGSVGRQLLDGKKSVTVSVQAFSRGEPRETQVTLDINLEVDRVAGFSSHAAGEQILNWVSNFDQVGSVYVVHGTEETATRMAEKIGEMGIEGFAPERNETFTIKGDRSKPSVAPAIEASESYAPASVDR